ncbi:MAG: DNA mismatch repair protein MutS [Bdellovibrionales bacterium]
MSDASDNNGKPVEKAVKLTPLMQQYGAIKEQHQDKLLLFRMGDFYELFNEDAKVASEVLNITLTKRNKKADDNTFMCGFPHHAMESPVNKLLDAGYCVAICDQLEDPSQAKGIVKRGVTLLLSPGVVFNTNLLEADSSHYILSFDDERVCWIEPSTGRAYHRKVKSLYEVKDLILRINPKEILCLDAEKFDACSFYKGLKQNVSESLAGKKVASKDSRKTLLNYLEYMQGEGATFGFTKWVEVKGGESLGLNANFFKHVEVFKSNEGDKQKSLFNSIKKTKTPGGTRLLRHWLETPLVDLNKIRERQRSIYKWKEDYTKLVSFRETLSFIGDIERRVARAGHPLGSPQDMLRLRRSLEAFLEGFDEIYFEGRNDVMAVKDILVSSIEDDPVGQWQTKGGYIKKGFSAPLDELIDIASGAQSEVNDLEEKEREATGISGLKVRFNNVFGFYIEISKAHKGSVPEHYVRKQTLTNAERYTTQELTLLEEKVLSAKAKKTLLEKEVYSKIKEDVRSNLKALKSACEICNLEDVYASMAYLCFEKNYSIPEFGDLESLEIKAGFHPVVADELIQSEKHGFITNEVTLNEKNKFFLITGPNMAGKSTMMRQTVVISYLGQCGLVVPAESVSLPIYDSIFTRVGASDILSEGLSTFMVEMKETAEILEKATSKSLLILDEIGRGTSSSDGAALAQSIVKYILSKIDCHTLFATHYHELTEAFSNEEKLKNIHMGYSEKDGKIVFTYKIKEGASQKSYGIEVAKLAGLPDEVVEEAKLFSEKIIEAGPVAIAAAPVETVSAIEDFDSRQMELPLETPEQMKTRKVIDELSKINPMEMTPLEALTKITKWQDNFL